MAEIVAPRNASTILLLRDNAAAKEIEVFMMQSPKARLIYRNVMRDMIYAAIIK